jgi:hypothetical protein
MCRCGPGRPLIDQRMRQLNHCHIRIYAASVDPINGTAAFAI